MADNQKFPKGIRAYKPHDKAPGFVKANLHIHSKQELIDWLNQQPGELRLSLKEGKDGAWYLMTDDYQPKPRQEPKEKNINDLGFNASADDLPF